MILQVNCLEFKWSFWESPIDGVVSSRKRSELPSSALAAEAANMRRADRVCDGCCGNRNDAMHSQWVSLERQLDALGRRFLLLCNLAQHKDRYVEALATV